MASIKTHSISRGIAKVETKVARKARIAKAKASVMKQKALSKEERLKAQGLVKLNKAKRAAARKKVETEAYIKKHPWKSVGIAAGIGLLFGKIFMRGKKR